jgi:hypothetical protein
MSKIILLDIDGVLTTNTTSNLYNEMKAAGLEPEEKVQFKVEAINQLNQLIEATHAKIVIISMWRRTLSNGRIKKMLCDAGFKYWNAILDTEHFAGETPKADEVEFFLNKIDDLKNYVIIDDHDSYSVWQKQHLVTPDPEIGFNFLNKEKAIKLLKRKMI